MTKTGWSKCWCRHCNDSSGAIVSSAHLMIHYTVNENISNNWGMLLSQSHSPNLAGAQSISSWLETVWPEKSYLDISPFLFWCYQQNRLRNPLRHPIYQISLAELGTSDEYLRLLVWAESDMLNIVPSKWCEGQAIFSAVQITKSQHGCFKDSPHHSHVWFQGDKILIWCTFPQKISFPLPDLRVHDHSPQFSALPIVSYWAPRMRNQRFGLLLQYLERWFFSNEKHQIDHHWIVRMYLVFGLLPWNHAFFQQKNNKNSQSNQTKKKQGPKEAANGMSTAMLFWPVEDPNQTAS